MIELPEHAGLLPLVIEVVTEGATELFTVTIIPEEVSEGGLAHARLEVITQVISSPLVSPAVV